MSGGEYDYPHYTFEDFAERMLFDGGCYAAPAPLRRAFRDHLRKVAEAAKAIEWNDSGDGDKDETRLIMECLKPVDMGEAWARYLDETIGNLAMQAREFREVVDRYRREGKQDATHD